MLVYRFTEKDNDEILYTIKLKERLGLDYATRLKLFFIEEETPSKFIYKIHKVKFK